MKRQMYKCKCGGEVGFDFEAIAVAHTLPTCEAYEALDVDKLMQGPMGSLALAIHAMEDKPSA